MKKYLKDERAENCHNGNFLDKLLSVTFFSCFSDLVAGLVKLMASNVSTPVNLVSFTNFKWLI